MRKLIFIVVSLIFYQCTVEETEQESLFLRLDSTSTHIGFRNEVSARKKKLSVVDYLYYYNGAGVAAGDINNDGLTDLFFVSNEHWNKLYLNKGGFQFEDISAKAGIEGFSHWKTGVTMADVNGDGFLDIYVCAVGDYMGLEGSNELYINNGDNTFTERSSEYGLDFTGFSTQAAFFDYDHDGDLDMYLLTHGKFISRSFVNVIANLLPEGEAVDYLFGNEGDKFTDVSDDSGIRMASRGYGMGISIADLDNDGWEDIYVTNDFYEDDNCFINNANGTFREEGRKRFGHFSHFPRGCDIADMNNDGFEDVMTVDISSQDESIEKSTFRSDPLHTYHSRLALGYYDQFSRNALQLNNAGVNFSDRALLSGVASTDYSWSTLLADYDNDGYKDIFVTTGTAAIPNDLDYLDFANLDSMRYAPQLSEHQLDRNMKRIPERRFHNYLYQGSSDLTFEDRSADWGMTTTGIANGAVYSDLDNDGDLDLVTNNLNEGAGIYRNRSNEMLPNNYLSVQLTGQGKNTFGIGAKVYIKSNDGFQMQHIATSRGFLSSVSPVAHFGLGANEVIDSLVVVWNDRKTSVLTSVQANQKITVNYSGAANADLKFGLFDRRRTLFENIEAPFDYVHKENKYSDFYREKLMPFLVSTEGPKIAVGDVDNDGLDDIYIGGAKYQPGSLFIQQHHGNFRASKQADFLTDSMYEDTDATFFDVDKDNDLDLYVVTGGNEFYGKMDKQFDRIYRNDGRGNFTRDTTALPPMFTNKSCVRPFDFDGDGDLDVFVGGRVEGYNYGRTPPLYLLENDGKGKFTNVIAGRWQPDRAPGMITDAAWADTDNDGDTDLVVTGDWMRVRIYENSEGSFREVPDIVDPQSPVTTLSGWWQCLLAGDFDGDGDIDLVAGNLGKNSTLRKNGDKSLVKMWFGDFDNNKMNDHIVAFNRPDGKFYPAALHGLPDTEKLSEVMTSNAPLVVDQFASLYFENRGKNKFRITQLPDDIQTSKIFSLLSGDFNNDGNPDVLAAGNFTGASIYQGNYDASHGVVLAGDGKGNFKSIPMQQSGLDLEGETRDIKTVNTSKGKLYLAAKNNGPVQAVLLNKRESE